MEEIRLNYAVRRNLPTFYVVVKYQMIEANTWVFLKFIQHGTFKCTLDDLQISRLQVPCSHPFLIKEHLEAVPIGSMYGIFTYICHVNPPNVGKLR